MMQQGENCARFRLMRRGLHHRLYHRLQQRPHHRPHRRLHHRPEADRFTMNDLLRFVDDVKPPGD